MPENADKAANVGQGRQEEEFVKAYDTEHGDYECNVAAKPEPAGKPSEQPSGVPFKLRP